MKRVFLVFLVVFFGLVVLSGCQTQPPSPASITHAETVDRFVAINKLIGTWKGAQAGNGYLLYAVYEFEQTKDGALVGQLSFYRDEKYRNLVASSTVTEVRFLDSNRLKLVVTNNKDRVAYQGMYNASNTESLYQLKLKRLDDKLILKGEGENLSLGYNFHVRVDRLAVPKKSLAGSE